MGNNSFEENISELEKIVSKLENSDVRLDETIAEFESKVFN